MSDQKLEVFTDYVCPWCYLGESRIKKIKKEFKVAIQLIHFPLHPETPIEGRTLLELFGSTQDDIDQKNKRMKELMVNEGLPYNNRSHTYNSRLAQEIGIWAQTIDNETSIHDNFFEAYFVQGLNVGLESVILDVVSKSGLDTEEAKNVIKNRLFKKNVDEDWNKSKKKIEGDLDSYLKNEAPKKQIDLEKDFSQNIPDWSVLAAKELVSTGKVELSADSEGVIRAGGENPDIATYTIVGATSLKKITGFRLTTVKVNKKGAGRADNGNFVINQFRAELLLSDGRTQSIPFKAVEASHSQNNFDVGNTIDGKIGSNSGWAVSPKINQDNFAIFASNPISVPRDAIIRITIVQSHGKKHTLGGLRLEVTESSSSSIFNFIPSTCLLYTSPSPRDS